MKTKKLFLIFIGFVQAVFAVPAFPQEADQSTLIKGHDVTQQQPPNDPKKILGLPEIKFYQYNTIAGLAVIVAALVYALKFKKTVEVPASNAADRKIIQDYERAVQKANNEISLLKQKLQDFANASRSTERESQLTSQLQVTKNKIVQLQNRIDQLEKQISALNHVPPQSGGSMSGGSTDKAAADAQRQILDLKNQITLLEAQLSKSKSNPVSSVPQNNTRMNPEQQLVMQKLARRLSFYADTFAHVTDDVKKIVNRYSSSKKVLLSSLFSYTEADSAASRNNPQSYIFLVTFMSSMTKPLDSLSYDRRDQFMQECDAFIAKLENYQNQNYFIKSFPYVTIPGTAHFISENRPSVGDEDNVNKEINTEYNRLKETFLSFFPEEK